MLQVMVFYHSKENVHHNRSWYQVMRYCDKQQCIFAKDYGVIELWVRKAMSALS